MAEWIPVGRLAGAGHRIRKHDRTGGTDKYLVANAYYAYSTRIVRDAADALGYAEEAKAYGDLYEEIVEAIHVEYVTRSDEWSARHRQPVC